MVWQYGIDGFLYWVTDWWYGYPLVQLPRSTHCHWQERKGPYGFGDGRLVYPAPVAPTEPDSTAAEQAPVISSIRCVEGYIMPFAAVHTRSVTNLSSGLYLVLQIRLDLDEVRRYLLA